MKKGFTLIEVLVSISLILIIGSMMVSIYIKSFQASNLLYSKETIKLKMLEDINYYANHKNLPEFIDDDSIYQEIHNKDTIFYDGVNSTVKTTFGPVDLTKVSAFSLINSNWVLLPIITTYDSGSIIIAGYYDNIILTYDVVGWDYVKERRFVRPNISIISSFIKPTIDSACTDNGQNIPLTHINVFDSKEGRVFINGFDNQWTTMYYQTPKEMFFKPYLPKLYDYSYINNNIYFNNDAKNNYLLITYKAQDGKNRIQLHKVSNLNEVSLNHNIINILKIKCLTLEYSAEYDDGKKISYIMAVKTNEK
jgi:prepilin-type N-terminal cleavage/methylation domain-containing protein